MRQVCIFIFTFFVHLSSAESLFEPGTGELMLKSSSGFERALSLKTEVAFDITGMVAHITVNQRFKNDTDDFVEGVYVFLLPEDSAVNHMEILIGDRKIVGEIKEKSVAKRIYQQARSEGKRASLVTQSRPNMFRNKVANIPPQSDVEVELKLV